MVVGYGRIVVVRMVGLVDMFGEVLKKVSRVLAYSSVFVGELLRSAKGFIC